MAFRLKIAFKQWISNDGFKSTWSINTEKKRVDQLQNYLISEHLIKMQCVTEFHWVENQEAWIPLVD